MLQKVFDTHKVPTRICMSHDGLPVTTALGLVCVRIFNNGEQGHPFAVVDGTRRLVPGIGTGTKLCLMLILMLRSYINFCVRTWKVMGNSSTK